MMCHPFAQQGPVLNKAGSQRVGSWHGLLSADVRRTAPWPAHAAELSVNYS